jgi:hypothetical protein
MNNSNNDLRQPTRRDFTLILAGALSAIPLASTGITAQTPTPSPSLTTQPTPTPLTLALMEVAKARFGAYLSPEQQAKLLDGLGGLPATADRLRAVKLENSDEPDLVFSA